MDNKIVSIHPTRHNLGKHQPHCDPDTHSWLLVAMTDATVLRDQETDEGKRKELDALVKHLGWIIRRFEPERN